LAHFTNRAIYAAALASLDERHRRVLDVGCGTGLMTARLAGSGRNALGIDFSGAMIARARCRRGARAEFVQADAENLPIASGTFDAVVNLISLHHYRRPARAVAEFRRVLRPGGRLVVIAFDRDSRYIRLAQRSNRWLERVAGRSWQKTRHEVLSLVRAAGFAHARVESVCYPIKTFMIVAD
jgi:ubiquinone/menaquinone biosynthesis C-methylase UbiE